MEGVVSFVRYWTKCTELISQEPNRAFIAFQGNPQRPGKGLQHRACEVPVVLTLESTAASSARFLKGASRPVSSVPDRKPRRHERNSKNSFQSSDVFRVRSRRMKEWRAYALGGATRDAFKGRGNGHFAGLEPRSPRDQSLACHRTHGVAEVKPLTLRAIVRLQKLQLLCVFHPCGDHL
jgi:hypothetical protein